MADEDEEEPPEGNQGRSLPRSLSSSHPNSAGNSHPFARSLQVPPFETEEGSLCGISDMPVAVAPSSGVSTDSSKTTCCSLQVPALKFRENTESHHCSDPSCPASINEQARLPCKAAENSWAVPRPCGVAVGPSSSCPSNSSVSFVRTFGNQEGQAFFRPIGSHSTSVESSSRRSVPRHGIPKQNLCCSRTALDGSLTSTLITPSLRVSSAGEVVNPFSPASCKGSSPTPNAPSTASDSLSLPPRLPHIRPDVGTVFTSTSYGADTSIRLPVTPLSCPGSQRQAVASCHTSPVSREVSSSITFDQKTVVSSLESNCGDVPSKNRMCLPTSSCGGVGRSFSSSSPSFSGPYTSRSRHRGGEISSTACFACGCYNEVCCSDGDKGDGSAPSIPSCLSRIVVHIDADCFYAQVEELLDPLISGKPVAVRQKQLIVTANLVARRKPWGVKKGIYLPEAMRKCPVLIVKNGENLDKYRRISDQILSGLKQKRFLTSYLRSNFSVSSMLPVSSVSEPSSSCLSVVPEPSSSLSQSPPLLISSSSPRTLKSPRSSSRSSLSSSHMTPVGCSTPPSSRPYCSVSSPAVLASQASDVVVEAMKSHEILVRRLGLDDFFIDVTSLVKAGAEALQRFLSPSHFSQEGRARVALMGATDSNEQATEGKGMPRGTRHASSEDIRAAKVDPPAPGDSCTIATEKEGAWKAGGWPPFSSIDAVKHDGWGQATVAGLGCRSHASPSDSAGVICPWGNEIQKNTSLGESTFFPTGSIHEFFSPDPRGARKPPGQSEPTSAQSPQFTVSARPSFASEQCKSMETFSDRQNASWQGWCVSFAPYVYPEKADDPDNGEKDSRSGASRRPQPMCHRCIAVWWPALKGQGEVDQQGEADSKGSECEESQIEHRTACRGTQGAVLKGGKISRNSYRDVYSHTACTCLLPLAVATHLASAMRSFIKKHIGLTTTAGVSTNMSLAKLVGAHNKPSRQTVLLPQHRKAFLSPLPLQKLPGVGYALLRIMYRAGIRTCRDLLAFPPRELQSLLVSHNYRYASSVTSLNEVSKGQITLDFYGKKQISALEKRDQQKKKTSALHRKDEENLSRGALPAAQAPLVSSQLCGPATALRLLCSGDENEPVVPTVAPKSLSAEDSYVHRGVRTPERFVCQVHRLLERVLNRHSQHLDMYGEQATVFRLTIRQKDCNSEGRQLTLPPGFWSTCIHHGMHDTTSVPTESLTNPSSSSSADNSSSSASPSFSCPSLAECRADAESVLSEWAFSCTVHGPLLAAVQAELPPEVTALLRKHCIQWIRGRTQTSGVIHLRAGSSSRLETDLIHPLANERHDNRQQGPVTWGRPSKGGRVSDDRGLCFGDAISKPLDTSFVRQDGRYVTRTLEAVDMVGGQESSAVGGTLQELENQRKQGAEQRAEISDSQNREDNQERKWSQQGSSSLTSFLLGQRKGTVGEAGVGCVPSLLIHYSVLLFSRMAVLGPLDVSLDGVASVDEVGEMETCLHSCGNASLLREKPGGVRYFFDLHKISVGFTGFKKVDGDSSSIADNSHAGGSATPEMSGSATLDALWGAAAARRRGGKVKKEKLQGETTEGLTTRKDEKDSDAKQERGPVEDDKKLSELECISIFDSSEEDDTTKDGEQEDNELRHSSVYGDTDDCDELERADGGDRACQSVTSHLPGDMSTHKKEDNRFRPSVEGGEWEKPEGGPSTRQRVGDAFKEGKTAGQDERESDGYDEKDDEGRESDLSSCEDSVASGCTLRISGDTSEADVSECEVDGRCIEKGGRAGEANLADVSPEGARERKHVCSKDERSDMPENRGKASNEELLMMKQWQAAVKKETEQLPSATQILSRAARERLPNDGAGIFRCTQESLEVHHSSSSCSGEQAKRSERLVESQGRSSRNEEGPSVAQTGQSSQESDDVAIMTEVREVNARGKAEEQCNKEAVVILSQEARVSSNEEEVDSTRIGVPLGQAAYDQPVGLCEVDSEWLKSLPVTLQEEVLDHLREQEEYISPCATGNGHFLSDTSASCLANCTSDVLTETSKRQKVKWSRTSEAQSQRRCDFGRGRDDGEVKKIKRDSNVPVVPDKKKQRGGGGTPKQISKPRLTLEKFFR
ncbi:hypothetical protein CSUI_003134 [Cystoisospora suis]|uniref:UmuC domain-containing protein n=1 Tax=Cystoisospora suis TaxID=483139 RepID=A0A2C6L650_9APIC|nr:hypothetical protein CSUI_003134 [Cystoisospora suis]